MKNKFKKKRLLAKNKYFLKEFVAKYKGPFKGLLCWRICYRSKHGTIPISGEIFDPAIGLAYLNSLNNKNKK